MAYTSYNIIGTNYDATRHADPYLSERLVALLDAPDDAHILDVGCGTGNYSMALAGAGFRVTGVDPSEHMLEVARAKSVEVDWHLAFSELLPFPDAQFDGASAMLTTHHWNNIEQAFKEIARVMKPGARLVILTSTPDQTGNYWLSHYFPRMIEASCKALPTFKSTLDALKIAGFDHVHTEKYDVRRDLKDLFLYSRKHDPRSYLDPEFRQGSSSFAALANKLEVEIGLEQLKSDIHSGAWDKIQASYSHDLGDYLFIVAER